MSYNVIRENYPIPTGPVFGRALEFVKTRVNLLKPGGIWIGFTEKPDFVSALKATPGFADKNISINVFQIPSKHEGTPQSEHLRDNERFTVIIRKRN